MNTFDISDFDYVLPPDRIAQTPLADRASAKLLVALPDSADFQSRTVKELPAILAPGDCLVLNNTRVRACRLAENDAGRRTEVLLVRILRESDDELEADAIVFPGRRFKPGRKINLRGFEMEVLGESNIGRRLLIRQAAGGRGILSLWQAVASVPMPPYVHNPDIDPERYQTCVADPEGSVAAPTAGLHFTKPLLAELARRGVEIATLTLHVGPGTFRPVGEREIESGRLHAEPYSLNDANANIIARALAENRRVIAVGTTVCRTLEWIALRQGSIRADSGETDLFIRPGFNFKVISGLLTNFHLPRTSLLMLVAAFMGTARMKSAYPYALEHDFRFYSFGDGMLILRRNG